MYKKIKNSFDYKFNISKNAHYIISIEAGCQSGKILGLFDREDLRVEIDNIKLREIPAKNRAQYYNIPPAWNGNKLKGLSKAVIFILKLEKGEHTLKFLPKKGATIDKEPIIKELKSNKILENIKARERNRQPWITIALIGLPLKTLDVSVVCEKRKQDSDDLGLIIDGQIQKNNQSSWWGKNWHFRGSQMQGQILETRFYPKLPKGIHYVEFWADRTPTLNSVTMDIGIKAIKLPKEKAKEIKVEAPTVDSPKWTGDYNNDSEQMILARAIWGEARGSSKKARIAIAWSIKNRLGQRKKWNSYHNIILALSQYSAFLEKSPKDSNLQALRDPLGTANNSQEYKRWKETYKIAGQVIEGIIPDPTNGATHYYDDSIDHPSWARDFRLKIENLNFFYAK